MDDGYRFKARDIKNSHMILPLGQKYARIFVLGHSLFLEHIFAQNGDYCLFTPWGLRYV